METTTLEDARSAFAAGAYEKALQAVRTQHAEGKMTPASVRVAHDCHIKMGELHRALGEINRLRTLAPSAELDETSRRILGRIIETDPTWLPTIRLQAFDFNEYRTDGKRVLHILKESTPYSETGFTMRSRMTLAAQRKIGLELEVVTSLGFPRSKGVTDFPESQIVDDVRHHHLDAGPDTDVSAMPADVSLTLNANLAAEISDQFAPTIVQSGTGYRGFETALIGIALAARHGIPFVYEVRGFQEQTWTGNIERSERGEYYRRRRAQENRCMDRADWVITIADAMAAEIIDRGIAPEKVAVVPNAVDVTRFTPREKRPDLIDRYGLHDRFTIGYISNLGRREGIDHLIRAIGILRSRHKDVVCLIVGDGPERALLGSIVRELDLNRHVVLAGHVPNETIEDHYALIDLFVVPRIDDRASRYVTPLKPLEAMSMGLPVISSALPALEELVAPGERGMTFPPSDPGSLADTIEAMMENSGERDRMASAGQAWVKETRTLESNAARYERIFNPLLS